MWEAACLLIPDQDLLGLEASQLLDAFVDVTANEVAIASVHLSVCLLNKCNPHFMRVSAGAEKWLPCFDIDWDSFIDDDINPLEVLENSNHKQPFRPEAMEDWRIDTI